MYSNPLKVPGFAGRYRPDGQKGSICGKGLGVAGVRETMKKNLQLASRLRGCSRSTYAKAPVLGPQPGLADAPPVVFLTDRVDDGPLTAPGCRGPAPGVH
ncbi:hypothetical protein EYF80_007961 [Liparis tanakae]|uniref:Uncharacterized protein n=1 Tax=Liparis tanakae TaxID=230148 RepID=A0A4Z2IX17_9TELE|nr:hypothetical protein EYF80_007961 [Liparis tanakae]